MVSGATTLPPGGIGPELPEKVNERSFKRTAVEALPSTSLPSKAKVAKSVTSKPFSGITGTWILEVQRPAVRFKYQFVQSEDQSVAGVAQCVGSCDGHRSEVVGQVQGYVLIWSEDGHGRFRANLAADGHSFSGTGQLDGSFSLNFQASRQVDLPGREGQGASGNEYVFTDESGEMVRCSRQSLEEIPKLLQLSSAHNAETDIPRNISSAAGEFKKKELWESRRSCDRVCTRLMLSKVRRVPAARQVMATLRSRPARLRRLGLRFSSDRKPDAPKGFGKFYEGQGKPKGATAESAEAKPAEGSKPKEVPEAEPTAKDSKGPKETPAETKAEGKAEGKDGKGAEETGKSSKGKEPGKDSKDSQTEQRNRALGVAAGGALVMAAYFNMREDEDAPQEVTMQEMLKEYLTKGNVEKIQIVNQVQARVFLRKESQSSQQQMVTINLGRAEAFEQKLENVQNELGIAAMEHIPVQYINETDYLNELLPYVPSLLFLIPLFLVSRSIGGGMPGAGGPGGRNVFSIGKAFPSGKKDLKSTTKFADVAGLEQAKAEVVEFVDFLKSPGKYEKLGARVPKGGLFVGPPGTGKTLLAKAVAGEADCPFYSMSGSDFVEMYVGVGASRVRDLFKQARDSAPSIIFIDEIDAIGRKRGKGGFTGGNDERESTLNQMLVEMDGFGSSTGVVVLAGTNRVDILDNALLRPGRFDRQIAIDRPDMAEREKIYMVHLKPLTLETDLKHEDVSKRMAALTPGFAGADIANVCNEAAIFAARRGATAVSMDDFERATERVIGGLPKNNSLMSADDKRTVAIHESGHAVAGWFLEHADPLLKVSIQPRSSGALGFAQYLPAEMSLFSKEAILDKIAVALGGRAAEELFVGKISTGASDDLDKVTKMAHAMVANYGMSDKIGLLNFGQNDASSQFYKPYSEATGQLIDRETREVVDQQYERVKKLLLEHQEKLKALTGRLDQKETLAYNELVEVLGERPYAIKKEISGFVTAGSNPFTEKTEDSSSPPSGGEPSEGEPRLEPA